MSYIIYFLIGALLDILSVIDLKAVQHNKAFKSAFVSFLSTMIGYYVYAEIIKAPEYVWELFAYALGGSVGAYLIIKRVMMIDKKDVDKLSKHWKDIKYFTITEILNGRDVPEELLENIIPTVKVLDKLREFYGKPIYINSTYRPASYNKAVGGKPKSLHLEFNAIDFTVENIKDLPKLYGTLCEWDAKDGFLPVLAKPSGNLGLGIYKRFLHIDTRAVLGRTSPARWSGN